MSLRIINLNNAFKQDKLDKNYNEDEISTCSNVNIQLDSEKNYLLNSTIYLTTHRLILIEIKNKIGYEISLHYFKGVKTTGGLIRSKKVKIQLHDTNMPPEYETLLNQSNFNDYPRKIVLKFTNNPDSFINSLQSCLDKRIWDKLPMTSIQSNIKDESSIGGASKISSQYKNAVKASDAMITESTEDLKSLNKNAAHMIALSKEINKKLNNTEDTLNDLLVDVGVSFSISKDKSRITYLNELCKNIANVIFEGNLLKINGGMITLIDLQCQINRSSRGQLISPQDCLESCEIFQKNNIELKLIVLSSNVAVIMEAGVNTKEFCKQIYKSVLDKFEGNIDEHQQAEFKEISVFLAKQQLVLTEEQGFFARDDSLEGLKFYRNLLLGY